MPPRLSSPFQAAWPAFLLFPAAYLAACTLLKHLLLCYWNHMLLTDLAFPTAWREDALRISQALLAHDSYLVCAHARLDGDALSSMAAMGLFLQQHGKRFLYFAPHGIPDTFAFVKMPAPVYSTLDAMPFRAQTVLALDCGKPDRLGEELAEDLAEFECINIDHHVGSGMGTIASMVVPEASSTTQVLASVFHAAGCELEGPLGEALAIGLITDTGGFRHGNSTPEVFALASYLEQKGVSVHRLREQLEKNWTLARMHLWGRLYTQIQLLEKNRLAICPMTLEDLDETGATAVDTEGFVEHLRELRGVQVACFVREQKYGVCKFSLRSCEGIDVQCIAESLGGGGHVNAAGGTMRKPLEVCCRELQKAIAKSLAHTN